VALETSSGGRDLQECINESRDEIDRLEIEVAWCRSLLRPWIPGPPDA
jgi:hypothetical protein